MGTPGRDPIRETSISTQARDALTVLVCEAIETQSLCYYLYLLAKEDLDRPYAAPFTATTPNSAEQPYLDWVRTFVQRDGATALEHFVAQVRRLYPQEARRFGAFLPGHLTQLFLIDLDRLPPAPARFAVERLSPDSRITMVGAAPDGVLVLIPYDVTERQLMDLRTYLRSLRQTHQPGRRRTPPGAPRTPPEQPTDREARRAWAMHLDGATRETIARALFPDAPLTTTQERRRVLVKVDRRIARGRRLAHPG
jgi:hypothetical protein